MTNLYPEDSESPVHKNPSPDVPTSARSSISGHSSFVLYSTSEDAPRLPLGGDGGPTGRVYQPAPTAPVVKEDPAPIPFALELAIPSGGLGLDAMLKDVQKYIDKTFEEASAPPQYPGGPYQGLGKGDSSDSVSTSDLQDKAYGGIAPSTPPSTAPSSRKSSSSGSEKSLSELPYLYSDGESAEA